MFEHCPDHNQITSDISEIKTDTAVIKTDICYIKKYIEGQDKKINKHVDEGEKQGGFRDRLIVVEQSISTIKKSYWKACIVSGLIGGLLGKLSPDLFNAIIKLVYAGQ